MKIFLTSITAIVAIIILAFALHPFAMEEEPTIQVKHDEQPAKGKITSRIAEFPIYAKQQREIDEIRTAKQKKQTGIIPLRLEIPAIQVDTAVIQVGKTADGQMEVPDNTVQTGWYDPGYKPGGQGKAVIAGHVDSKQGPAVFFYLKELQAGDKILLTDKAGRKLTFAVQTKKSYLAEKAPIDQIFGSSTDRLLNLITCTGTFDTERRTHIDRLVVTAKLVNDSAMKKEIPKPPTNVKRIGDTITWHANRAPDVIGYRVYQVEGKKKVKIASVATTERKSVVAKAGDGKKFVVVSVNSDGVASSDSEIVE
ncbi:peptidase C60 sortase A and B [Listeria weihenstephanensis FSL R9-0317]|uniref:class F sortase n=1 Tax=Listeria weihenstephanensis TaxID=1006155 RepID=UPI0003E851A6|nr:sortase [Listeria weihenstephanensis]EUJ40299.1 peptidase C60 sortase A and B [Listeria weihenstephanensis FSL R9-0317]